MTNCVEMLKAEIIVECAGPWNGLPAYLKDETLSLDTFKRSLKTYLFATY